MFLLQKGGGGIKVRFIPRYAIHKLVRFSTKRFGGIMIAAQWLHLCHILCHICQSADCDMTLTLEVLIELNCNIRIHYYPLIP